MKLLVLMEARDSPGCQGQEKRRQVLSKSSTSRTLQALLQSLQREELDAASPWLSRELYQHGSEQQHWALTPAGTKCKHTMNFYLLLTLFRYGHLVPTSA